MLSPWSVRQSVGLPVLFVVLGLSLAGCQTRHSALSSDPLATGSTSAIADPSAPSFKRTQSLSQQWAAKPGDAGVGLAYADNLSKMGQTDSQVEVLKQTALAHLQDGPLQAQIGKQLLAAGRPGESVDMLNRATTLPGADWRTYSALGSAYDSQGQYDQAQVQYQKALAMAPHELAIQNNMGLSYALQGKMPQAEKILRQASADPSSAKLPRIRQNLALAVGLQGRFDEARQIASQDLPADQVEANLAYLQQMLAKKNTWAQLQNQAAN